MSYKMHQTGGKFTIRSENIKKALATIQIWAAQEDRDVEVREGTPLDQLVELFVGLKWRMDVDTGAINHVQFEGSVYNDDDDMFRAIAPHVEAGSHICMVGDDDETWHWYFDGQEMINQPGTATYEFVRVVIEVRGGVADVTECPPGIEVEIIDHDNREEEGNAHRVA